MPLYLITIDVPNAPRLGATSFDVEAASASEAETEGRRRFSEKWAVGAPIRVVARDWSEISRELAADRADAA